MFLIFLSAPYEMRSVIISRNHIIIVMVKGLMWQEVGNDVKLG